jgi:serine phosphatase RsbU (regulator of sigma subunit)
MARRAAFSLWMAGVLVCGNLAAAQPAPQPTTPSAALAESQSAAHVALGQSAVALYGPWKFTVGDSPIDPKSGKPLWAEPHFDDSLWENVDLTPKKGAIDPISGLSGYVPGWTARGHRGYWGYAWYRIRVQLQATPGDKLALAGPSDVDDVYQAFDNGKLVGSFGNFSTSTPTAYYSRPMMFQLPPWENVSARESTQVLAFRLWMLPSTLTESDEAGGFHTAPLLGQMEAISAQHQLRWEELIRAYAGVLIEGIVFSVLGVVALSLTLFDPSDRVYLWIGALLLSIAAGSYLEIVAVWTQWIGPIVALVVRYGFTNAIVFAGWVVVWRVWFRLRRPAWIPWVLAVLAVVLAVSNLLAQNMFFTTVSLSVSHASEVVSLCLRMALTALMLITVIQGIREQGQEGWAALPAMLLAGISEFYTELQFLHILNFWFPFGIQITTRQVANLLLVAVLAALLLRRLVLSIRRQRQLALDVKQAQEVQQVILPEARLALPGLTIESEYRPAREVGGDFFQIIPHKTDGSLLIVAGDVTGKGLKAGMLVALLVGAIRSIAQFDPDPTLMLWSLNQRLMGRSDAQATCLALRIASDGAVTLANAGHMAPYLNGEPIAMVGALPLGMIESAEFSLMHFELKPDDKLMLMSDGIAEATDAEGHLFGFERVHELLRRAKSAAEVANAAQSFGQEDDISVISVTRTLVLEPALA